MKNIGRWANNENKAKSRGSFSRVTWRCSLPHFQLRVKVKFVAFFQPFPGTSKLNENIPIQISAAVTQDNQSWFVHQSNMPSLTDCFDYESFSYVSMASTPFDVVLYCLVRIIATFPPAPSQNRTVLQVDLDTAEDRQELNGAIIDFFILQWQFSVCF